MSQILRFLTSKQLSEIRHGVHHPLRLDFIRCQSCFNLRRQLQKPVSRTSCPGLTVPNRLSSSAQTAEHLEKWKQISSGRKKDPRRELSEVIQSRFKQLKSHSSKKCSQQNVSQTNEYLPEDWLASVANFRAQMDKYRQNSSENSGVHLESHHGVEDLELTPEVMEFNLSSSKIPKLAEEMEELQLIMPELSGQTDNPLNMRESEDLSLNRSTENSLAKNPEETDLPVVGQKSKKKGKSRKKDETNAEDEKPVSKKKRRKKGKKSVSAEEGEAAWTAEQPGKYLMDIESNLIKEINEVLSDTKTDRQVVRRLEEYLSNLIRSEKLPPEAYKAPFWRPETLQDMSEIKDGLQVVEKLSHMSELHTLAIEKEIASQQDARNKQYMKEVNAYIDVCLHVGLVRKAHSALVIKELNKKARYRSRKHQDHSITDPSIFNKVMAAWAKKGDLNAINRLFQQMKDTNVAPNFQSHVIYLEALGRQSPINAEAVKDTISAINKSDWKLEDLRKTCTFQKDELEHVMKAIHSVEPGFAACLPETLPNYTCPLLNNHTESKTKEPVRNPHQNVLGLSHLQMQAQRQLKLEQKGTVTVGTVLPSNTDNPAVLKVREKLEEAKQSWRECLEKAFKRDITIEDKKKQSAYHLPVVPYLKLFPHATFVKLMMQEIDTIALETENYSPSLGLLQRDLGRRVNQHYLTQDRMKSGYIKKFSRVYQDYLKDYLNEHRIYSSDRECWQHFLSHHTDGTHVDTKAKIWPPSISRMVGRWLYNLVLLDIKIDANIFKDTDERNEIPAFYTVYRQEGPLIHECIKPHPLLVRLYRSAQVQELTFETNLMPLLTPPLPWHSVSSGANLMSTTNLIINPAQSLEQMEKLYSLPENKLNPVYDALNALSATPWRINKPILDHVTKVFNSGGDTTLKIPTPATSFPSPPKITLEMTDEEKMEVLKERQKIKKEQQEMHSLWMTELYRLSIADHYKDDVFWFPHNMDFRSRVYATPPHFNHLGSDLARSLLVFAQGKKLGGDGLDWLKIHLINLTGFKKRSSNAERLAYANEIMPDIMDSADKPWEGNRWWQSSDEPWQTLACCIEIVKAVRSGDPANYVCRFPVHQDGSCNGLQHYAALGRDQAGAESVNLYPYTHPKDVYSDVVELVEEERLKDAAAGKEIAIVLDNFIKRKVIKQTIMTTVYGVTRYGARLQIEGQLQDMEDFPKHKVFDASLYLTQKTFYCLQKMFTSTKEIQDWFTVCAKIVSGIFYKPMQWETPLGWPVIQPYYRNFNPANVLPKLGKTDPIEVPNTTRQKNGFPPNYIHSLDSTHMMVTAIMCKRAGISFVSVHDCFWTHPTDVATMNKICREQFVSLHSQPILEDLALFMYKTYGFHPGDDRYEKVDPLTRDFINHVLLRVPARGTFDLQKVLESPYFFS